MATLGEQRVRASFNPNENPEVKEVKAKVAELIDWVEGKKSLDPRLGALAQTALEEAAMWAVKLVTTQK